MCFNEGMAWFMTILGIGGGFYIRRFIPSCGFVGNVMIYFALMEFLQALTYPVLDQGCTLYNQILTALGGIHICFQPFVTSYMGAMENEKPELKAKFWFNMRLSFLFGVMMFCRCLFEMVGFTKSVRQSCEFSPIETETLRGQTLCSYRGKFHMTWNFPLADVTYYFPSIHVHWLLSFGAFFVHPDEPILMIKGMILMLTGPVFSELLAGHDKGEVAAIWCLYSVGHLCCAGIAHFVIDKKCKTGLEIEDKLAEKLKTI